MSPRRLLECYAKSEAARMDEFSKCLQEGKPWRGELRKAKAYRKEIERLRTQSKYAKDHP